MGLLDRFKKKNKEDEANKDFIKIEVQHLIDWDEPNGEGCIVSDKITKEGWKVGYMFRDEPNPNNPDSGWSFFKGDEDEEYTSNPNNCHIFSLNTICNYDQDIIPYLHSPIGTCLIRTENGKFIEDDESTPIQLEKQSR